MSPLFLIHAAMARKSASLLSNNTSCSPDIYFYPGPSQHLWALSRTTQPAY